MELKINGKTKKFRSLERLLDCLDSNPSIVRNYPQYAAALQAYRQRQLCGYIEETIEAEDKQ